MPAMGMRAPKQAGRGLADRRRCDGAPRGSIARGTSKQAEQLVVPVAGVDVEQQRARGVGDVGDVDARRRSGSRPASCRWCRRRARRLRRGRARPATWSRIQRDLGAGEVGVEHQAGLLRGSWLRGRRLAARRRAAAVRRSCQTMALWTGSPVARSQTTVVSRWLVMPMAAMSRAPERRPCEGLAARPRAACPRSPSGRARPSRAAGRAA